MTNEIFLYFNTLLNNHILSLFTYHFPTSIKWFIYTLIFLYFYFSSKRGVSLVLKPLGNWNKKRKAPRALSFSNFYLDFNLRNFSCSSLILCSCFSISFSLSFFRSSALLILSSSVKYASGNKSVLLKS